MKHAHTLIPVSDAKMDVSDWWREVTGGEEYVEALFDTFDSSDSYMTPAGHGRFREVEYLLTLHHFIGLTVEDSDDIRFVDLPAFLVLDGIDAPELIGAWQDQMDRNANE